MQTQDQQTYLQDYHGLNRLWRLDYFLTGPISQGHINSLAAIGYEYSISQKFWKKADYYGEMSGKMIDETLFATEKIEFETRRQEIEKNHNYASAMGDKAEVLKNYLTLGDLYLEIGDLDQAVTQFRLGKNFLTLTSALSLVPSLKKVQMYQFDTEGLAVVPHTSLEIYTNTERSQTDFERFHIACMMISMKLFDFSRTLDLAKHIKLNLPSAIDEFTSKRDLAYYITISLISLRDYRAISEKFQDPVLYNFLKNDSCAKDCISSLVRNNWKLAVQNLKKIFYHLSMDPLIGAKSNQIKNICLSSIIIMYLEAFTVIKIESLASDLEISPKDVTTLLEQEIKAKKINFLINKVGGYVERSDKQ